MGSDLNERVEKALRFRDLFICPGFPGDFEASRYGEAYGQMNYMAAVIKDQQARIQELEDALRGLLPFRTAPQMGTYQECQRRIEAARKALSAVKDNNET